MVFTSFMFGQSSCVVVIANSPTADEARRVVDTAASQVDRALRIRTERPRAIHQTTGLVHGDEAPRWSALLYPELERRHRVERARSLACGRARCEEQTEELLRLAVEVAAVVVAAVQKSGNLVVVLDAACGGVHGAAPRVGEDQLAAALAKRGEIRIDSVDQHREVRLGVDGVRVKVEATVIPVK